MAILQEFIVYPYKKKVKISLPVFCSVLLDYCR